MSYRTLIDAGALAQLVERMPVLVCDCRFDLADGGAGRIGYRAGHIPGAVYLDLEADLSAAPDGRNGRHPLPDRRAFAERMAASGLDMDMQVVAYDISGGFYASRLWWMLRWAGHDAAAVLDGGLEAWTARGLALEAGEQKAARHGNFAASPQPAMLAVNVGEIEANLVTGDRLVIDARSAERFRGEFHALDPVSGHIPGAGNRFFQNNLTPDGRFKSPAELAQEFDSVLGGRPAATAVHQCGSGVTATHNLLAMEIAGLGGSALYPGSWSEWINDPARPIATGPDLDRA